MSMSSAWKKLLSKPCTLLAPHTAITGRTNKQDSRLAAFQAQLLPQLGLGGHVVGEGRPDGQPMHDQLRALEAHLEPAFCCLARGYEAFGHALVEPGVVACCKVGDHRCKVDGSLQAIPAQVSLP